MTVGRARIGCFTILALVALRLAIGWHFFSEGREKLTYDPQTGSYEVTFSAESFLAGAKGPLADTMLGFAAGTHDWRGRLAKPQQIGPLSEEERVRRAEWQYEYAQRRAAAAAAGEKKEVPIEMPEFAPYVAWGRQIVADWQALVSNFVQTHSLTDEQRQQAEAAMRFRHEQLADYLAAESGAIADYRHELWRLAQMKAEPTAGEVPFQDERIARKQAELGPQPRWVAQVKQFDENLRNDLRDVLTDEQKADGAVEESLNPARADPGLAKTKRVNFTVTCVVLGVGVCLLLGFFTRLASLVGIGFLLSVMASQPPWVAGAKTDVFLYQLVECAAFLVLMITAAGRWFGIDCLTYALWNWFTGKSPDDD